MSVRRRGMPRTYREPERSWTLGDTNEARRKAGDFMSPGEYQAHDGVGRHDG